MRKDILIEINNDDLKYKEFQRKRITGKRGKLVNSCEVKYIKNNFENIRVNFKNKNLFIVVNGEEIYVKYMVLPKVRDEEMYYIIKNELKHRFENIDNIMFTYEVFKDMGESVEVIVFCLNWNKFELVKSCAEKGAKVKGIFPIQFKVLDSLRKNIKEQQYIIIFLYKDILYFLACIEGKIVANTIIKDNMEENFISEYEKFKIKYEIMGFSEKPETIYFFNFPYRHLIDKLSKNYNCKELDRCFQENMEYI